MNFDLQEYVREERPRHVGFEIEYAGVGLRPVAEIIAGLYGGTIDLENDLTGKVRDTRWGDFKLLLDSAPLHKLHGAITRAGADVSDLPEVLRDIPQKLGDTLGEVSAHIVPFEVVLPPVPVSDIPELESLVVALRQQGGLGTRGSLIYAFGLHINPEAASLSTESILGHLQSFLLLEAWLREEHNVDFTRRLSGFIAPFSNDYRKLVLNAAYKPDLKQLITDYHRFNPTRSRTLDLLPLFAHLDHATVEQLYGKEEKISPRPTYHYRLPNCELGNADWTLGVEWERWRIVETLAASPAKLARFMEAWQQHYTRLLTSESDWLDFIDRELPKSE